jgi:ornithine carbamoyltransferase
MKNKDLLSIYDLSAEEINKLLSDAFDLKTKKRTDIFKQKTLGLIFEKHSTRTQVSFAAAMVHLGGVPLILNVDKMQSKRGEPIHDTALVLSSYLDGLIIRSFKHKDVEEFAKYSSIPVINALTDLEHPCQILADIMTIMELRKIKTISELRKLKIVYTGDGNNNIVNSLLAISAILGLKFFIISPKEYQPKKELFDKALIFASKTNAEIKAVSDISEVQDADAVYTDVWTSMGFENETEIRKKILPPYQINSNLLLKVSKNCIVLHCLPAVRGEEITAEVMTKYEKSIFTEAENRLHIQKAILMNFIK